MPPAPCNHRAVSSIDFGKERAMPNVESEAIARVEYRPREQRMRVWFESGGLYDYFAVPGRVYEDFIGADSKGRYFAAHVRDRFAYQRLN
jgi:hypothetical protein